MWCIAVVAKQANKFPQLLPNQLYSPLLQQIKNVSSVHFLIYCITWQKRFSYLITCFRLFNPAQHTMIPLKPVSPALIPPMWAILFVCSLWTEISWIKSFHCRPSVVSELALWFMLFYIPTSVARFNWDLIWLYLSLITMSHIYLESCIGVQLINI